MEAAKNLYLSIVVFVALFIAACSGGGDDAPASPNKPTIPESPKSLQAIAGNNQITLVWPKAANASGYNVYWSIEPSAAKDTAVPESNVQPGFKHTGLTNGEKYYYRVTAVNAGGESLPSAEVMAIPGGRLISNLFDDAELQKCVGDYAQLNNWLYASEISGSLDCANKGIADINGLQYLTGIQRLFLSGNLISDISPLTYLVALDAIDVSYNQLSLDDQIEIDKLLQFTSVTKLLLDGNVELSCEYVQGLIDSATVFDISLVLPASNCTAYNILPNPTAPLIPNGFKAIGGDSKVTLWWQPVLGASSYNLYWTEQMGVDVENSQIFENVQPGFVHHDLVNQNTYYYIVTAVVGGDQGQASVEVSVTPNNTGTSLQGLFIDSNMQNCIDEIAAVNQWTFARELVGALDCSSQSIVDLQGVEQLLELNSLNLTNNSISDISSLASLGNLSRLYLGNNNIAGVDALVYLTNLEFLNLGNNQIDTVDNLQSLSALSHLYLNQNQISDVSSLKDLSNLKILDLRNNSVGGENVGNVDLLSGLVNAENILLAGNVDIACVELLELVRAVGADVVDLDIDSNQFYCSVIPDVPRNLQVDSGSESVILNWEEVLGATSYNLYWIETTDLNSAPTSIDKATANSIIGVAPGFQHQGLNNGTHYFYAVSAVNSAGESELSLMQSASPQPVPLTALFADANLQSCVDELATLNSWTTADQVTGLLNCSARGIADLSGMQHLTSLTSLSLNENALANIDEITYLSNLQMLSLYRNNITTVTPLHALTGLTELYLNNNSVTRVFALAALQQLDVLDLRNNKIGRQGIGGIDALMALSNASAIKLTGNPSLSCIELTALIGAIGTGVVDIAQAEEGVNCSNPSLVPTGVMALSGNNQITLNWNANANVSNYNIYWSTSADIDVSTGNKITIGGNRYVHSGLINDKLYYYIITALLANGESAASSRLTAIPSAEGISLDSLFPDPQLSQCIASLKAANGWGFTHEVVGTLNCSAKQISDLSGLEHLIGLQVLRLGSNQIQDISPIAALTNLTFLDLFNNSISNIDPLSGMENLRTLYLHNNAISDISALSKLVQLDYLILDENDISDISALSNLQGLSRLLARANLITDVTALAGLTQLTELYLNNNGIVDAAPLSSLIYLQQLDLRNNLIGGQGVGNIDDLGALTTVSKIRLSGNNNISCVELGVLTSTLGSNATDLGEPQPGVNCIAP